MVKANYENQTGEEVTKSYVDRVLKEAGLVRSPVKKKKGRSKYMKYPEYTLTKLGKSMMRELTDNNLGPVFTRAQYSFPDDS